MASDFIQTYGPLANDVATQTGLDPTVVLGIIDAETSGGQRVLSNNIFGISPGGKGGQYVARYPDVAAGTQAFITLMKQPRYAKVPLAETPQAQAQALVDAGYNTVDKTYAKKVGSRAVQFGTEVGYQDAAQPAGAPAAPIPAAAQPAASSEPAHVRLGMDALEQQAGGSGAAPSEPAHVQAGMDQLTRDTQAPDKPPTGLGVPLAWVQRVGGDLLGAGGRLAAAPADTRPDLSPAATAADLPASAQAIPSDQGHETPVSRIVDAAIKGATEGGGFFAPELHAQVAEAGPIGRYITNPLLDAAKGVVGGLGGAFGQTAYEAGNLVGGAKGGRDANALAMVLGAHAAMPGVVPGGFVRSALAPGEGGGPPGTSPGGGPPAPFSPRTARALPDYEFTGGGPFRTRDANIERFFMDQTPETLARMAETNPAARQFMEQQAAQAAAERQAAGERQGGGGTPPAETPETPEQAVLRTEADRLEQPGTGGGVGPPTRRAAGAAPTTEPIPEKTRAQRIVDLRKDVGQTVRDRATAGTEPGSLRDENVYIEGMPARTEAHTDLSNQAALDHKALMESGSDTTYKSDHEFNLTKRNEHMGDTVAEPIIGDENTIEFGKENRKATTSPEAMGVFRDQRPVDQGLLERAHGVFDEQIGSFTKSDPKRAQLERFKSDLFDAGNTPSELRKVRKTMTDVLEQTGATDTQAAQNKALRHHIEAMVDAVDAAMQSGAPRWAEWRQAWDKASRPINAQEFLQPYGKGAGNKSLWDREGVITFQRVQRLLEDIQKDHRNPTGKSLGMTDDDIQAFVNMRNELAPGFISDVRSRSRGSPTTKLLEAKGRIGPTTKGQIAGAVAGNLGLMVGQHLAGVHPLMNAAVTGSLGLYSALAPVRKASALRFLEQQKATYADYLASHLLNEQGSATTPYPNPLAPKTWPTPAPPP